MPCDIPNQREKSLNAPTRITSEIGVTDPALPKSEGWKLFLSAWMGGRRERSTLSATMAQTLLPMFFSYIYKIIQRFQQSKHRTFIFTFFMLSDTIWPKWSNFANHVTLAILPVQIGVQIGVHCHRIEKKKFWSHWKEKQNKIFFINSFSSCYPTPTFSWVVAKMV